MEDRKATEDREPTADSGVDGSAGAEGSPATTRRLRIPWKRRHKVLYACAIVLGVVLFVVWWVVLRIVEHPSWPPPADAVPPAEAQAVTEAFAARDHPARDDVAVPYAPATAADVQLFVEGVSFFPRILDDIRAAQGSVHILEFGFRPGEVADQFVPVLEEKARAGVDVRVIVDEMGSDASGDSEAMYAQLARAGVQVVVNNAVPLDRDGLIPDQAINWRHDEIGQVDHRKLFVVDGRIGWVGGAGIEDHFATGEYHDVFARVEGDVVRQMQAVFLMSFRAYGGPVPTERGGLAQYFPTPSNPGTIPATVLQNIPGGFVAGTQAIEESIERATVRLDIMNPYLSDDGMIDRIVAAGKRGVTVRLLVPRDSNNKPAEYTLEHNYGRLLEAGVQIWEYPAIQHAKVVIADDITIIGTINLDAWALYRNLEVALRFDSKAVADQAQKQYVDDGIARSTPGKKPTGAWVRFKNWAYSRFAYFY
jgi:cardiolipin synthase